MCETKATDFFFLIFKGMAPLHPNPLHLMQESKKKMQHEQWFNAEQTHGLEAFGLLVWKMGVGRSGIHLVYFGSETWPEPKKKRGGASWGPPTIYPSHPKSHSAI